jgi:4-O-beta-D-mannosyl-D-glucose phosphorylase
VERLLDYVLHTPEDPMRSALCVKQRRELWGSNRGFLGSGE